MPADRGISSAGRALRSHRRGQGFESPILHAPSPAPGTAVIAAGLRLPLAPIPALLEISTSPSRSGPCWGARGTGLRPLRSDQCHGAGEPVRAAAKNLRQGLAAGRAPHSTWPANAWRGRAVEPHGAVGPSPRWQVELADGVAETPVFPAGDRFAIAVTGLRDSVTKIEA